MLTLWKVAAVEVAVLGAVVKDGGGLFGMLPVGVFREVLWPWVKTAIMYREGRQVEQMEWIEDGDVGMSESSDGSESDDEIGSEEEDEWEDEYSDQEQSEESGDEEDGDQEDMDEES